MALLVVTSPTRVGPSVATSQTTATFDAPAGSILVACPVVDTSGTTNTTITMSNSGAALTWVEAARRGSNESGARPGTVAGYVAVVSSARTGMTVTATSSITGRSVSVRVYVVTGADTADPIGTVTEGSAAVGNNVLTTTAFTTEAANSLAFVVANESEVGPGNPTSSNATIDPYSSSGNHSGLSGYRATTTAGESVSFNVDAAGTSTAVSWNWVAFEIRNAPVTDVSVDTLPSAGVTHGSPSGETVEALSINLTIDDTVPAGTAIGSPAGETVSVDISDTVPAAHVHGSPSGENVGVSVSDTVPAAALVRSPAGETAVAAEPGLPAGGAPFVSLWAVDPDTGGLIHLPHALKVDLSPIRNSGGSFRFTYPAFGKNFEFLHNRLLDDQVAVEVELWVGGSRFNALGGDVLQVEGDDVAEESVWTFTGQFFTHRLSWATVVHDPAQDKGERHFGAATAGTIMRTFLQEAQGRGTLTDLTFATFSTTHDSAGVPWANTVTMKFTPHADGGLLSVLGRLVALGLCEGEVDRDKRFLLYNAGGAGRDLTTRNPPVILRRAKDLLESNRRIDIGASGTDVYGTGAEGLYADAFDATARARWGQQIEKVVDSNQIENQGALDAFVQASRESVVLAPMELTHGLVFGTNRPAPVSGFRINDWLYSDVGRGLERVRVAQWVLSQDTSGITGSVTLNDIIADRLTRLARRLAALANGDAVVGTSNPPVDDGLSPAAPTGVTVDSIAYNDGYDTYATLIVGWSAVNTNSDGSAATDIAGYRVQWRPQVEGADSWRLGADAAGGTVTSTSFGGVGSGVDVLVRVAAYDTVGNQSAWSAEVVILTETDSTPPPTPSTPTGGPYLGQAKIVWNGLGSAGETMPADLDFVELQMSLSAGFGTFSVVDAFSTIAGERVITDLPYTVTHYFRLVAVDRTRPVANRSTPSGVLAIVPEKLVQIDIGPNAIGQAQIIDLEVVRAKIDNLAANNAKIADLEVGKLTAGVLNVAVTNAGIVRSGTSGQRYELDAAALRLYNSAGTQTVQLNGALNWVQGEFRTALSGQRMVINPGGTNPSSFRLYPTSGSTYAEFRVTTFSGRAALEMYADRDDRSGFLGLYGAEAFIKWGDDGGTPSRSAVSCAQFGTTYWGPSVAIEVRGDFPNDGGTRRIELRHRNGSGVIKSGSVLYYQESTANQAMIYNPFNDLAITWANNSLEGIYIGDLAGNMSPITALDNLSPSSRRTKKNEKPIRFGTRTALAVVAAVESKSWNYDFENTSGQPVPGRSFRDRKERRDGGGKLVVGPDGEPVVDEVVREGAPQQSAKPHFFPIAEDLLVFAPDLVRESTTAPGGLVIGQRDTLGLLWQAVRELNEKVDQGRPGPANK